jgi:hypothetical protein
VSVLECVEVLQGVFFEIFFFFFLCCKLAGFFY